MHVRLKIRNYSIQAILDLLDLICYAIRIKFYVTLYICYIIDTKNVDMRKIQYSIWYLFS